MAIPLYPHQREAIRKMKNGCILCGGVGTGKSRTALAYYYEAHGGNCDSEEYTPMDDLDIPNLYIITTAKKRDECDWEMEMVPFGLGIHDNYNHMVCVDSWNNIGKYKDIHGAFFIFDEQRVVGKGAWVNAFLKIAKSNEWILLSATPGDTWSDYIPVFIANGFYKNRTEFNNEHVVYKRVAPSVWVPDRYINTGRLIRLRERILVDMEYARKTIPHHETVYCGYNRDVYRDICKTRWNPIENKPIETASEFCGLLRKVVNASEEKRAFNERKFYGK